MGRLFMPFLFVLLDVICMSFTEGLTVKLELVDIDPGDQSLTCTSRPDNRDSAPHGHESLIPVNDTKWPIDLCDRPVIDAAVRTQEGTIYLFLGKYYVQYGCSGILPGYPRRISDDWHGISGPIDAGFGWYGNKVFLFKGDHYWRFTGTLKDNGYPRKISDGFPGIPHPLDAVVVWDKNQIPYFFKGDKYWRFDSDKTPQVNEAYPLEIEKFWNGVPVNVDAAISWDNNSTYIFKGSRYYKYDSETWSVVLDNDTAGGWFNCHKKKQESNNHWILKWS